MKVFISWSGTRSRKTANLLYRWLPQVINEIGPWISDVDIAAGGDWSDEIKLNLNTSKFGIICVTPGNQKRPWLLFEAGALSRQMDDSTSRVAPFLIDFREKSELRYPLARFQATEPTKDDMLKLLLSINSQCAKPRELKPLTDALDVFWPMFEQEYSAIRDSGKGQPQERRSEYDLLQEILGLVRSVENRSSEPSSLETYSQSPTARQPGRGAGRTAAALAAVQSLGTMATLYTGLQRLGFAFAGSGVDTTGEAQVLIVVTNLGGEDDLDMRLDLLEGLLGSTSLNARIEVARAEDTLA